MKKTMRTIKCYSELAKLKTFDERFRYLAVFAKVGIATFGDERYLNQEFYHSREWRSVRDYVIVRDHGCDLGVEGLPILEKPYIHHMNPLTANIFEENPKIALDPEYLISCCYNTHQALHYGNPSMLDRGVAERFPWDTCPWKIQ